jgi:hypothetical protein
MCVCSCTWPYAVTRISGSSPGGQVILLPVQWTCHQCSSHCLDVVSLFSRGNEGNAGSGVGGGIKDRTFSVSPESVPLVCWSPRLSHVWPRGHCGVWDERGYQRPDVLGLPLLSRPLFCCPVVVRSLCSASCDEHYSALCGNARHLWQTHHPVGMLPVIATTCCPGKMSICSYRLKGCTLLCSGGADCCSILWLRSTFLG